MRKPPPTGPRRETGAVWCEGGLAGVERRSRVRIPISARVRIIDGALQAEGEMVNVSHEGAMIVPERAFEPSSPEVALRIRSDSGVDLGVLAAVCWVDREPERPAIGVRFDALSTRGRQWVEEVVWIGRG